MSRNYQGSPPFEWLRVKVFKIDKPYALGWGQWATWDEDLKKKRPFAFFMTETLPDWLEKPAEIFIDPIQNVFYYLRNRFLTRTHMLHTGLEKGKWHEFESRLLHGAFTELVTFVEIEKAWMSVAWSEDGRKKYNPPWWRNHWWSRWKEWRCRQAGIDHLKWEISLEDESPNNQQARNAFETMLLYTWWVDVRPNRGDEWDVSGLRTFWDSMEEKYGEDWLGLGGRGKMNLTEKQEYERLNKAMHQLEEDWHVEDEEMLVRLVKLRRSLWT
jgi:hypothetical protein